MQSLLWCKSWLNVKGLSFTLYLQFWAAHWLHRSETWGQKKKKSGCPKEGGHFSSLLSAFCGPLGFVTSLLYFAFAFFATKLENEAPKAADAAIFLPKHDNMHCTNTVPWIVSNLLNWSDSFHWNLDKEGHRIRVAHLPFAAMFDLWSSSFLPEDRTKKTCCFYIETLTASLNQY